jgi:nitroimidazol reductase NimA-like FMN-containing flavoprotein (pyridoxamine 5'-phosphate oxidase superfamily)
MPRKLTETESQQFLAGKHIAVVSVAATNGRPPASVPLWYTYTPGGDILIVTGAMQRKARLIEQAGAVTVVVQREELPYQYVIVEGTVVDAATPAPVDVRESIAIRYLGEEAGRAFVASLTDRQNVLFTIRPDRWFSAEISEE